MAARRRHARAAGGTAAAELARDGRRIAYISNETGNTSLWIVEVPGGRRTEVRAERRVYRSPVGRLRDPQGQDLGPVSVLHQAAKGAAWRTEAYTAWGRRYEGFANERSLALHRIAARWRF